MRNSAGRLSPNSQRRFAEHKPTGSPMVLAEDHPAVVEGRSLFTKTAGKAGRLLVSGHNSRKIGKRVTKGKWKGMLIFTLTLEERKTCPRSCGSWFDCYGNKMHWSRRNQPGPALVHALDAELHDLQQKHPEGFVVRLHVLGDFYSIGYVHQWAAWLDAFPALHVFGYTARDLQDPIGCELHELIQTRWERFAVRSSGRQLQTVPHTVVVDAAEDAGSAIVCPAQTGASDCCATCGLCWQSKVPVAFLRH